MTLLEYNTCCVEISGHALQSEVDGSPMNAQIQVYENAQMQNLTTVQLFFPQECDMIILLPS